MELQVSTDQQDALRAAKHQTDAMDFMFKSIFGGNPFAGIVPPKAPTTHPEEK